MRVSSDSLFTRAVFSGSVLAAAVFMTGSVQAIDLNITDSVEINTNEPRRITVRQNVSASGSGKPVILTNASLGGILIDVGRIIDTSPGPFDSGVNPAAATIYIAEEGVLEGVLDNQGHIRDGVFIQGSSTHESSGAYWSQGQDATNQASLAGGYNVLEGRRSLSRTFDTINIDSHSYIDFITVGEGGGINSAGEKTSAIHVDELGRIGGNFSQTASAGNIVIERSESDTALRILGDVGSITGRAINILGSVTGKLEIGPQARVGVASEDLRGTIPAVAVEGSFTGTMQNQGEIYSDVMIRGTHQANEGAAYWSRGTSDDQAILLGGFIAAEDGIVGSTTAHGIHLDEYSKADRIGSVGDEQNGGQSTIYSNGQDRNAIYVHQLAELGVSADEPAIVAANGGEIISFAGDAIVMDGTITGTVLVNNGRITAESQGASAINFLSSNTPLNFIQRGDDSLTTGSILASAGLNNDLVQFHGGRFVGTTIQNVDELEISTKTASISITSDLVLPALTTILLEPEVTVGNHGQETTGIDTTDTVITVGGELGVESTGSRLLIKPVSIEAHNMISEGTTLTIANAGDISRDVNQLDVDYGNPLLSADATVESNQLIVTLTPFDTGFLADGLTEQGLSETEMVVIKEALDASLSVIPADEAKALQIFETISKADGDYAQLAKEVKQGSTGGVQKAGQGLMNNVQRTVDNRLYGLRRGGKYRRGLNFGGQFSNGATWGQFIYSKGTQQAIDSEPGFGHKTLGLTLGTDAPFEENSRIGLALSLSRSAIDGDDGDKNENYNFLGSVYASWNNNTWFFDSILTVGRGDNDIKKYVQGQEVKGTFSTEQWGFRFLGGLTKRFGNWDLSPLGEFNFGMVRNGKFEEKGNTGFEQSVTFRDYRTVEAGAGLKLKGEYWFNKNVVMPEFNLMGYYNFVTDGSQVKTAFLAGGNPFTVTGPERDKFRFNTGLGLGFRIGSRWTIRTLYDYSWSKHYKSDSFTARTRYEF
ncbi:MAG: autotransporter outer membrane beta-barrel domain-containing protein [Endozoicomonas sp.]